MNTFRHSATKPKGHTFVFQESGRTVEHDTLQCVHCGAHWEVKPGSGRTRGFCMKCMGPTCGLQACDTCVPQEKMLEQLEKIAARQLASGLWVPGH